MTKFANLERWPSFFRARLVCDSPPGLGRAPGSSIARCLPGLVRYASSGFPHVSNGPGGHRAWHCALVLVFDALRDVLDRRIFRLLRITRFSFLNLCSPYSLLQSRMLLARPGQSAPHHRTLSFGSAQFLLAVSEPSAVCTFFFSTSPKPRCIAAVCWFLLGAVFFARMTPARNAFHGFQIGFKKVQQS